MESMFEPHVPSDGRIINLCSDSSCVNPALFSSFFWFISGATIAFVSQMGILPGQSVAQLINGFFGSCVISCLQPCGQVGLPLVSVENGDTVVKMQFPSPSFGVVACRIR